MRFDYLTCVMPGCERYAWDRSALCYGHHMFRLAVDTALWTLGAIVFLLCLATGVISRPGY